MLVDKNKGISKTYASKLEMIKYLCGYMFIQQALYPLCKHNRNEIHVHELMNEVINN